MADIPDATLARAAGEAGERELAAFLRATIEQQGMQMAEVSRTLQLLPNYVTQLLRGNLDLKLYQVLEILAVIGVEPADFFAALHGTAPSKVEVLIERVTAELTARLAEGSEGDAGGV